jgi:hypothetical protein
MSLLSSSFFFVLELSIKHPGVVLVLIGVFGEIALEWKKTKDAWLKKAFWVLLIMGLVLEFREAAKSDLEAAKLEQSNLELQIKLQPRTITTQQVRDFMDLTKSITNKIYIKVIVGDSDGETERFAGKIRSMLDEAGFGRTGEGVIHASPRAILENNSHTNAMPVTTFSAFDVAFEVYGKNDMPVFIPINFPTNGMKPIIYDDSQSLMVVFGYVGWAFSQIDMHPAYLYDNDVLKPGEIGIFVPTKNH